MTDYFSAPEDLGDVRQSELQSSLGEQLGARALDAVDPSTWLSGAGIGRAVRQGIAGGFAPHDYDGLPGQAGIDLAQMDRAARAAIPDVAIADARARVKQEGLEGHMHLPDAPAIKAPVLDLMVNEAHERRDREAAIARGPQGFLPGALGLVTSLGAGMVDPVNAAAFSVPVLGEARWGKLLASAGDSILARTGARALQGGAQGAVGTALLQPADWWLHTRDGQDYTFADALKSVAMGAGMGAGFHATFGGIGDTYSRLRGRPLPGSPEELLNQGLMSGRHIPGEALDEVGIAPVQLAELGTSPVWALPEHPADVLADLPPAAREDIAHAAAADVIADRPVRGAEILSIAADHDPRIAESFDAYHGSPHDFDRFDSSQIGTGEGAQSYGHGLYFAENEKVARSYKATTSDKVFVNKVAELYDQFTSPGDAWSEIESHWGDFSPGEQRLMKALQQDDWLGYDYPHQAVNAALRGPGSYDLSPETAEAARALGHMYQVRVKADRAHFLDWDKSVAEQSPPVRSALLKLGVDEGATGEQAYRQLAAERLRQRREVQQGVHRGVGDRDASGVLADAGVPGIKYLDKRSRAQVEGTHNFVVFNDRDIEITHKNGEPIAQADLPPRLHALSAEARNWPELPQGARVAGHGDNGPVVQGLEGRWGDAVSWLRSAQTGDAIGVLEHPEVPGRIDIVWGDNKYGLAHIDAEHPGEADSLPQFWDELRERPGSRGRYITLESDRARAVIARDYRGDPKHWLLTYFELKRESGAEAPLSGGPGDQPGLRPADDLRSQPSGYYSGEGAGPDANLAPESPARNATSHGERAAAAAEDPRWRAMADARPAYDEPQAVAESRAADAEPEPASTTPKSLSAIEQAAAEAEDAWRGVEAAYTEEERRVVNDALDKLALDREAREQIIKDGAACLMAAGGEEIV